MPKINPCNSNEDYFRRLCFDGLYEKFSAIDYIIKLQLKDEVDYIIAHQWTEFFLIALDCVEWIKEQGGYVGPGRGFLPSLMVPYVIGITEIHPYDFYFHNENYLRRYGANCPVIEIDVSVGMVEKVSHYIAEKYNRASTDFLVFDEMPELDIIQKTQKLIQERYLEYSTFDITKIDLQDKKTFEVFSDADTDHIFKFDSADMKCTLLDSCPIYVIELAILLAIKESCNEDALLEYCLFKNDKDSQKYEYKYEFQILIIKTFNIIIFQEDFLRIIREYTGCSLEKAEYYLQVFSRYRSYEECKPIFDKLNSIMEIFAQEYYTEWALSNLFEVTPHLQSKAHAISRAFISYRMAYLKAHFPQEFIESINSM